ncbi:MAG TPA: helix-turn-helix domain-containing protein [Thermoanaerobaculia bacterium]|nr:helix-turn-helix domain-containing protein [Thermoanaerobaculia bacterium]
MKIETVRIDRYILETLLADLVGHDKFPTAFVVYVHLWNRTFGEDAKSVRTSHQRIADDTGLSKSGVQAALRHLNKRKLVRSVRETQTATPEHFVLRPWRR